MGTAESSIGLVPMAVSTSLSAVGLGGNEDVEGGGDVAGISAPCGFCAGLSLQERIIGFAVSFLGGVFLQLASFASWTAAVVGKPERFAVCYTLGNILMLSATCFLVGPERQWSAMKAKSRRVASGLYLGCMPLTLFCVYGLKSGLLTVICIGLQCVALGWYALSYIPFGRRVAARMGQSALRWIRG